jgi:transposase
MGAILSEVDTSDRCPLGVEMDTSQQAAVVPKDRDSSAALKRQRRSITEKRRIVDDTPVPVLAPGRGKTKTGRLWTYVRDDRPAGDTGAPAVWFAYSPDRKGEHPAQHLEKFRGTLQAVCRIQSAL